MGSGDRPGAAGVAGRGLLALVLAVLALAPAALAAGGSDYKPLHLSGDWSYGSLFSDNGGCDVYQPVTDPMAAAAQSALSIHYQGIAKPSSADLGQTVTYNLRGTVSGRITDANGNTFDVSGRFFDRTTATNRGDLQFDGTGQVTLSGTGGTLAGDATLRLVSGPNEVQLHFVSVDECSQA